MLYKAAELADQAYESEQSILRTHPRGTVWVSTPGTTNVQYVFIVDHRRKRQFVAVRGTVGDVNWQLDKDRRGVKDKRVGVLLHRGFRRAADAIYKDLRPRLVPGYATYLTGHSLGGAVAAIIGIYLWDDGLQVGGIVTFGQPKFIGEDGALAYRDLPILRVVYQNDTVSLLPQRTSKSKQRFAHVGPVVNLFSGPYYSYLTVEEAQRIDAIPFQNLLFRVSLPDHKMKWYLQGLSDKVKNAKQVPFSSRERYIVRHKYGTGVDTAAPKRSFNFNQAD